MVYYKDKQYNFIEYFNEQNGVMIRSNVLHDGFETTEIPSKRSFPELIDIGIMGTCSAAKHGICLAAGVDCYQNAASKIRSNMTYNNYERILKECEGRTFQVALGGAGDPNKHELFEQFLKATREHKIIPNLTTSGFALSNKEIELIKRYCGAVAVSYYSKLDNNRKENNPITVSAINRFVESGCTTNIHYVLSNESIDEALFRVKYDIFPDGINAVIFLLYKPVGLADAKKMLTSKDKEYLELISLATGKKHRYRIGFDSCQTPAIYNYCPNVSRDSLEYCDAARFSMYIDCDMIAYPCSFGHDHDQFSVDLNQMTIQQAWQSEQFKAFLSKQEGQCLKCSMNNCRNCALDIGIELCGRVNK